MFNEEYEFKKTDPTDEDIVKCLTFIKETGLRDLLASKKLKNLVDYMVGVEAGLDSNGRKNRGGHAMENIVEVFVADACQKLGLRYLKEANAGRIKREWGYTVPVDKSSRRYDFVVETKKDDGHSLVLIEANFYGGGGSKLKATAGEYRNLYDTLNGKYRFIWITDGMGWRTITRPLEETFNHNDEILNLSMLEDGALEYMLK